MLSFVCYYYYYYGLQDVLHARHVLPLHVYLFPVIDFSCITGRIVELGNRNTCEAIGLNCI